MALPSRKERRRCLPRRERRGLRAAIATMKARVTVITLGVDNLEASLAFYRHGLGLPTRGIIGTEFEHGALALFDLQHGLKLAIYPRADLAYDARVATGVPSATECTVGHYLHSSEDVDAVMRQAEQA